MKILKKTKENGINTNIQKYNLNILMDYLTGRDLRYHISKNHIF